MRKKLINFRFHGFDLKRAMDLLKRLRSDDDVDAERVVEDQKETTAVTKTVATSMIEPDYGKGSSKILTFPPAFDLSHKLSPLFVDFFY